VQAKCIDCGAEITLSKTKISPRCEACRVELKRVRRQHDRDLAKAQKHAQTRLTGPIEHDDGVYTRYQAPVIPADLVGYIELRDKQAAQVLDLMTDGTVGSYGSAWVQESTDELSIADERGRPVLYSSSSGLRVPDVETKSPRLPGGSACGVSTTSRELQGELLERTRMSSADPWFRDYPLWQYMTLSEIKAEMQAELEEARRIPEPGYRDEIAERSAKAGLRRHELLNGRAAA
jgi:hypothetical protein